MPGEGDGINVIAYPLPAGERGAEDRRLREARGLVDARKGVLADERRDLAQEVGSHGGDELAHAGLLAALPGEQDGGWGGLEHTVKEHTSALYRKLEVRNRAEAVQRAQRIGLLG